MSVTSRRAELASPYAANHAASVAARMDAEDERIHPASLGRLLAWARDHWALEVPDKLHFVAQTGDQDALGSPKWRPEFRRYLLAHALTTDAEDRDAEDREQAYLYPMHAALYRLAGPPDDPAADARWALANFLFSLPCLGWDWRLAAARAGVPAFAAYAFTEGALIQWWRRYERCPPARVLRIA